MYETIWLLAGFAMGLSVGRGLYKPALDKMNRMVLTLLVLLDDSQKGANDENSTESVHR